MKKQYFLIIFVVFIIVLFVYFYLNKQNSNEELYENLLVSENTVENNIVYENEKIKIHIYGEIKNPGLIEVNVGDRVQDAIEIAGGVTNLADISKVNLAYVLSDGEKIYIPSIYDEDVNENTSTMVSSKVNINTATLEELKSLNGVGDSLAESIIDYRNKNGKFNTIEDIKNVLGIGESKFEKIKDDICVK